MTSYNSKHTSSSIGAYIFEDMKHRITCQEWLPGSKLPSIRQLAKSYDVAPLTISRVIRQLANAQLVDTQPSRGVYVSEDVPSSTVPSTMDATWQFGLVRRRALRSFALNLPQNMPGDAINLATGTMANEAIPIETLQKAIRKTARTYEEGPVWERSPQGEPALREWFSADQATRGVASPYESTLIVSSTHQALRIIANTIIDPGDVVLIESPSDPIVMGVFELAGAQCIGVEIDSNGMNVSQAKDFATRFRPKAIVTCSSGQVPTGVTMSAERRQQLVQVGESSRTLIIEYDNGNEIYYDDPPPRPVKSWDKVGVVAYVRDIGRITMAGFRVGCLTLDGPLLSRLIDSKRRDDLLTSTLGQYALLNYVSSPDYRTNLVRLRDFYRPRRDAALQALEDFMPGSVSWYTPNVGLHIWMNVPPGISARGLSQIAATQGVIVAPSEIFSLDSALDNAVRITFANGTPELIREGILRLATSLKNMIATHQTGESLSLFELA